MMIRYNLGVTREIDRLLEEMADEGGTTKSEVLRRALTLMKVAQNGKRQKRHLGLTADPRKLETEIVGLR